MVRNTVMFLTLAVIGVLAFGCNSPQEQTALTAEEGVEIRVYEVYGMDCPGCHGGVEKLVNKIPAVEKSQANWKTKELAVVVRAGSELDDEEVYDAIRRANFTPGKRIR